jgi:AcrR family transcriptional regulator
MESCAAGGAPECAVCIRIGEAATTLLERRRLAQIGLPDVADEAEITPEVLGRHVATREDVLVCAYLAGAERLLDRIGRAFAVAPTWHHGVRFMVEDILRELRRRPGLDRVWYIEAPASSDARLWAHRDAVRRRIVALLLAHHEPDDLPDLRFEMLAGVLFNAVRDRVLAGDHHGQPGDVAAEVCAVVPVFEPEPVAV